jgi:hypothetical protein
VTPDLQVEHATIVSQDQVHDSAAVPLTPAACAAADVDTVCSGIRRGSPGTGHSTCPAAAAPRSSPGWPRRDRSSTPGGTLLSRDIERAGRHGSADARQPSRRGPGAPSFDPGMVGG